MLPASLCCSSFVLLNGLGRLRELLAPRRVLGRRRTLRASLAWGVLFLVGWSPRLAQAQANYDGVLLGGRTSMMGGTAVARGSDGAVAFLNPAGLMRIPGESFSFSTFAVQSSMRTIQEPFDPSGRLGFSESSVTEYDFRVLPNTFCLFLDGPSRDQESKRSRHKYGLCIADTENEDVFVVESMQGRASSAFLNATAQTTRVMFRRTSTAFAWGFEISPGTNIGTTVRFDNSRLIDHTSMTTAASWEDAVEMQTLTQSRRSSSWDTSITVGVTHAVSRVMTLGASLTTMSQHLLGFHDGSEAMAPRDGGTKILVQDRGDFRYNQPAILRLGVAFAWPNVNFELNGNFYGAQSELARTKFDRTETRIRNGELLLQTQSRGSIQENSKPVVNLAAGLEAFIEPDFAIVAGVQTDFSGLERRAEIRPADALFRQRKDSVHVSLGTVSYGARGSLLLGFRGYYSAGEILMADPLSSEPRFLPQPLSELGLSFVVSGQISLAALRDTALKATRTLTQAVEEAGTTESSSPSPPKGDTSEKKRDVQKERER